VCASIERKKATKERKETLEAIVHEMDSNFDMLCVVLCAFQLDGKAICHKFAAQTFVATNSTFGAIEELCFVSRASTPNLSILESRQWFALILDFDALS